MNQHKTERLRAILFSDQYRRERGKEGGPALDIAVLTAVGAAKASAEHPEPLVYLAKRLYEITHTTRQDQPVNWNDLPTEGGVDAVLIQFWGEVGILFLWELYGIAPDSVDHENEAYHMSQKIV